MRQEMNNMNFQKIVKSTVVPQYLSEIEKCKQYSLVRSAVEQMMPGKVYRFRKCEERSITAFWNDELWFSNGSTMNDDFDARLYYDKNRIEEWFSTFQDEEGCLKILHQIKSSGKVPIEIEQIIPNGELLIEKLSVMNKEESKAISIQFIKYVRDALDSSLQDITQTVQSGTKFACFTTEINSDMMWGHYADSATGFALEYNFSTPFSILSDRDENMAWCNLFPIIYSNKRLDATEYAIYLFQAQLLQNVCREKAIPLSDSLARKIVPCPDEFMATKLALIKSTEWEPEKEWRMFYVPKDMHSQAQKHSYVIAKPSAIYLGRKISELNQKIMVDIAREKNIPVYKMDFGENIPNYQLKSSRLGE